MKNRSEGGQADLKKKKTDLQGKKAHLVSRKADPRLRISDPLFPKSGHEKSNAHAKSTTSDRKSEKQTCFCRKHM
jgi:hypothetical protein